MSALLVPTNVSTLSIISCYAGLIGMCLPLFGLVFAVPAFVCGLIALAKWRRSDSYGGVTSNMRAVFGVLMSGIGILISVVLLVAIALNPK